MQVHRIPAVRTARRLARGVPAHVRRGAWPTLAALIALAGCGKSTTPTAPIGDTSGVHLMVFSSDRNQTAGQFDVYLYDLDAGGYHLIRNINSPIAPDLHPVITSDGQTIAFSSDHGTGSASDIFLYSRALQQLVPLPNLNTNLDETEPAFTGDAVKLAFTQMNANGHTRIRLYDGLGDSLLHLTGLDTTATATYNDWAPSPNQSGSRIAFVSDRSGNPDIYIWDAATHALLNLPNLNSSANDVDPCLSFDGRWLAFASDRAGGIGGYDLYLYDTLALTYVALPAGIETTSDERHPALSQSGNAMIYQSQRPGLGGWDLWYASISPATVALLAPASSSKDDIDPSILLP